MKSKRKEVKYIKKENLWCIYTLSYINLSKLKQNTFNNLSNNMHPGSWSIQAEHASSFLPSHVM